MSAEEKLTQIIASHLAKLPPIEADLRIQLVHATIRIDRLEAALRDLVEVDDRDNLTDPARVVTDAERGRRFAKARAVLAELDAKKGEKP